MEESLRQALGISQGSFAILVQSPISAALLLATAASLAAPALRWAWRRLHRPAGGQGKQDG